MIMWGNRQKYFPLIILLSSFILSSCFTVGRPFSSQVNWINQNKTTRQEIEKAFGPPIRTGFDSGLQTYSYGYYKYSAFGESQTKDLTIRFNSNNTVNSYTFSSSFDQDMNAVNK